MDDPTELDGASAALREATLSGLRWVAAARAAAELAAFASSVTLAHLIPPAEFGRAAVALGVAALAVVLSSQGFGAPLVQRREIETAQVETAMWTSLIVGLSLGLVTAFLVPLAADPLFGGRVASLIRLTAPIFVVSAPGAVPQALLQRRLDFRRLGLIEAGSVGVGATTAIVLAVSGVDAEAIVIGVLTTATVSTLLLTLVAGFVRPRRHRAVERELMSFGLPAALSAVLYTGFRNVDYAVLTARLSAAQVGFYWRAYQLGVDYQGKLSGVMLRLAFPIYSRSESRGELRRIRGRMVRLHATILVPGLALFIALAPVLIPWLLGERWRPAVSPAQILAGAGMVFAVLTDIGPVVLAAGRPRALLGFDVARIVLYGAAVYVAAGYGLTAVCVTVVVAELVTLVVAHYTLLDRLAGIPWRSFLPDTAPGVAAGAAAVAVAVPVRVALSHLGVPAVPLLVVVAALAAGAWALTVRRLFPAAWRDVSLLARVVLGRRRPSVEAAPAPAVIP